MDVRTVARRTRPLRSADAAPTARSRGLRFLAGGAVGLATVAASIAGAATSAGAAAPSFLQHLHHVSVVASTVPPNGDVNPYGVANVPFSSGSLVRGDTLVSNFNSSANTQGTGTTIVQVSPHGQVGVFAQIDPTSVPGCTGGVGLTTALSVLNDGYVVVGSLPTDQNGTPQAGCLIVLDSHGNPVETFAGNGINGPWDMTAQQLFGPFAQLFVTNVLNGTVNGGTTETDQGTVLRLSLFEPPDGSMPVLFDTTTIGSGFAEELNSNALVLGPTGVALGQDGTLYVADTVLNRIAAIPSAASRSTAEDDGGITVSQNGGLNGPLGLVTAPNGNLIAVNANDGNAVEVSPSGTQVDTMTIDPFNSGGDLFGLALAPKGNGILFVDDNGSANTLDLLH